MRKSVCRSAAIVYGSVVLMAVTVSAAEDAKWAALFNGRNLSGWNNPYQWGEAKVVDGEIHLTANKKFFLLT